MSDIPESMVRAVLASPLDYNWTLQGFGMLRTYLDAQEVHRLHIWDQNMAVDGVSVIHDHPWDFDSRIYFGSVWNQRYKVDWGEPLPGNFYNIAQIKTGEGGGIVPESITVTRLNPSPREDIGPGESYHMDAPEIHESIPEVGTVSVISRRFSVPRDNQFATVCWQGPSWVSAEPRPATEEEILHFVSMAKMRMQNP